MWYITAMKERRVENNMGLPDEVVDVLYEAWGHTVDPSNMHLLLPDLQIDESLHPRSARDEAQMRALRAAGVRTFNPRTL